APSGGTTGAERPGRSAPIPALRWSGPGRSHAVGAPRRPCPGGCPDPAGPGALGRPARRLGPWASRRPTVDTCDAAWSWPGPPARVRGSAGGEALGEDRDRVAGGGATRPPEVEIARGAAPPRTPEQRAAATVYTSGERGPMCAAAHAWVGLGRIVHASSSAQ